MALTNMGLKRPKLVSFWGGGHNVKEKEKRRGRERDGGAKIKPTRYGTLDFWYGNYFGYGFCMDHMEF